VQAPVRVQETALRDGDGSCEHRPKGKAKGWYKNHPECEHRGEHHHGDEHEHHHHGRD
jgi:hypothetical protein